MLIDTHCHLAGEAYDEDRDAVLVRAREAGVGRVVVIAEDRSAWERAVPIVERHDALSLVVGVHPHDAAGWTDETAEWLAGCWRHPRVVAAGEMGLDYHYDHSPRDVQRRVFETQLAMARAAGLPVVIHAREADDDVAAILRAHADVPAVLHSFSSGPSLLEAGLALGHYVSFSGMATFRNWRLDDAVRAVPLDRLLVETDGPFLAPVPYRGKRNEPAWVRAVAARIAEVRGLAVADLERITTENACRFFRLPLLQHQSAVALS